MFADSAQERFGPEVPAEALANPDDLEVKDQDLGSVGLLRFDALDGEGPTWTFVENIRRRAVDELSSDEWEGAGRDKRLLVLKAPEKG